MSEAGRTMTTEVGHSVWALARLAGCSDPDSPESWGASFLRSCESAAGEVLANKYGELDDVDATILEVADGLVPVYTSEVWATFVDLGAWETADDLEEEGLFGDVCGMEDRAKVALCRIAETLLQALVGD